MVQEVHIVLFQPEIPPNTGNIGRLCVCNDFYLHLIHPLGFSLNEKYLTRAGMDYWPQVQLEEHASWEEFEKKHPESQAYFFFSSKANQPYWHITYPQKTYLIFGSESRGLPEELHQRFSEQLVTIPMYGKNARCLNLSSAAAVAAYEVVRGNLKK